MNITAAQPDLVFFYFGNKVCYKPDFDCFIVNGLHEKRPSEILVNEVYYRMQDNVHVAPDGCRTFREVYDTKRGKWSNVLVPMLVNMQADTARVVEDALHGIEDQDVPF